MPEVVPVGAIPVDHTRTKWLEDNFEKVFPVQPQLQRDPVNFPDPILDEPDNSLLIKIRYPELWDFYDRAIASKWVPGEIDWSQDPAELETHELFTNKETGQAARNFVFMTLAFFAQTDGLLFNYLMETLSKETTVQETKFFYQIQAVFESIHWKTYSDGITELVRKDEIDRVSDAIRHFESIRRKALWLRSRLDTRYSFQERLIAQMCGEGIFFTGAFACPGWVQEFNILKGLTQSNELISRDEGEHVRFSAALYNLLQQKLPASVVHDIIRQAVEIESLFVNEMLGDAKLPKINKELLIQHVKHVANLLCKLVQVAPLFADIKKTPLKFMERWGNHYIQTSMFERRNTNYNAAGGNANITIDSSQDLLARRRQATTATRQRLSASRKRGAQQDEEEAQVCRRGPDGKCEGCSG